MTIIASLKVTNADRPRQLPVIVQRRNKLINALHDQLELARAEAEGREYLKTRRRHVKNPVTGEYAEAVVSRRPRAWFWTADDGKLYLCLRYGTRVLELAKGKSAIEVASSEALIEALETVNSAVLAGELDAQLEGASVKLRDGFTK